MPLLPPITHTYQQKFASQVATVLFKDKYDNNNVAIFDDILNMISVDTAPEYKINLRNHSKKMLIYGLDITF